MIQRSYRTLLLQLTRGFSKNDGHQPPTTNPPNSTKTKQTVSTKDKKPYKNRQPKAQKQKQKSQQKQSQNQKVKQQREESKNKKPQPKQKSQTAKPKKQKKQKKEAHSVTSWANTQLTEAKLKILQQQSKAKDIFTILQNKNEVETELSKYVEGVNLEIQHKKLLLTMKQYLNADFNKALKFFNSQILPLKANSEQSKFSIDQIKQIIVKRYIKEQNLQGLFQLFSTLENEYKKRNQGCLDYGDKNILTDLEMLGEFPESALKYQTLNKFLKITKLPNNRPQITKKIQFILKSITQKFANKQSNETVVIESFESFLSTIVQNKLLPPKIIKSDSFWQAIEAAYFFKCNSKQKYDRFFKTISQLKASIGSKDDYLQQFYQKFYSLLINAQLKSTNAETTPLKVNSKLIQKYQQFFETENKEGIVTILAICFINKYFSIPEHFFEEFKNGFSQHFPQPVIVALRQEFILAQLNGLNGKQQNLIGKSRQTDLTKSSRKMTKLKALILNKDYEKAMEHFTNEYFREPCIQKERLIIQQVLSEFITDQANQQFSDKDQDKVNERIQDIVHSLSSQYLWESWRKRQDLGYLFEDYYGRVSENEETKQKTDKAEKRFSYWDKYFQTKRAAQINSYEKLNQLNTIKEPNEEPYIQSQFNLNQLLKPQNYERYRQVADYDDQKQVELALYFYKVEAALEELKVVASEKVGQKILSFQEQLCQQNLALLQDFGIKDYNISIHDQAEFENRLANFKKYRGILRLNDIYHRLYVNPKQYIPVFGKKMDKKAEDIVAKQRTGEQEDQFIEEQENKEQEEQIKDAAALQVEKVQKVQQTPNETNQAKSQEGEQVEGQKAQGQHAQQVAVEGSEQAASEVAVHKPYHISGVNITSEYNKQVDKTRLINTQFLDVLRVRSRNYFEKAAINNVMQPLPIVNELLTWGLFAKQPMAIYMAEKLAMITGQIIPHQLAIRVSDFFSFYREIDEELFVDCKKCLTHIGKIERQFIYDNNKQYQHISYKPKFVSMTQKMNKSLKERLEDLVLVPTQFKQLNNEPREILRRASKGPVF